MNSAMKRISAILPSLLLLITAELAPLAAAPQRLGETTPLKEHLDRDWPNELIHYDYAFAPGEWRAADARMLDGSGKEVPAQTPATKRQ
jgi:hypothetical protein